VDVIVSRERLFREKLHAKLETLRCWEEFEPHNFDPSENHLVTTKDYIDALVFHLSEIYNEADSLHGYVASLRRARITQVPPVLMVRLEHVAFHISYLHYALEILSDERSWIRTPFKSRSVSG
jgi:hypothetical protein